MISCEAIQLKRQESLCKVYEVLVEVDARTRVEKKKEKKRKRIRSLYSATLPQCSL